MDNSELILMRLMVLISGPYKIFIEICIMTELDGTMIKIDSIKYDELISILSSLNINFNINDFINYLTCKLRCYGIEIFDLYRT